MKRSVPASKQGQIRIIGGIWRGRKIPFTAQPGLRPTPDRVRETLFNWLMHDIEGSRCLDLFAGSGALSVEALSRGASAVTAIDVSAGAIRDLRGNLDRLGDDRAELVVADACSWIAEAPSADRSGQAPIKSTPFYDIVFIDPPFRSGLAQTCLTALGNSALLAPSARIYVESGAEEAPPEVSVDWCLHREKVAGQVAYRLFVRKAP